MIGVHSATQKAELRDYITRGQAIRTALFDMIEEDATASPTLVTVNVRLRVGGESIKGGYIGATYGLTWAEIKHVEKVGISVDWMKIAQAYNLVIDAAISRLEIK